MPEDKEAQVAVEEPQDELQEVSEEEGEFSSMLKQTLTELEGKSKDDDPEKPPKDDETEEEEVGEDGEDEGEKSEDEGEEKGEGEEKKDETEEDEAAKRGKAVIEEERQREEEIQKKKAEAESRKSAGETPKVPELTPDDAKSLIALIPEGRVPKTITVGDVEIDVKEYLSDNPEVPLIAALQTQEVLVSLINQGKMMTAAQHREAIREIETRFSDELFGLALTVELINLGNSKVNARDIIESEEFNKWGADLKDDTVKALFRSANPRDYALGLQRFINREGVAAAKKKVEEHDKKAAEKKRDHLDLHTSTMRGNRGGKEAASRGGESDDFGALLRDAVRDIEQKG